MLTLNMALTVVSESEAEVIRPAFNSRTGKLKTSKPFARIGSDESTEDAVRKGSANYVWRMLAFDYSGYGKNSCMPVTADFDLSCAYYHRDVRNGCKESNREARRAELKERLDVLDVLVKRVESVLPVTAQAGAMRWGRALGLVG